MNKYFQSQWLDNHEKSHVPLMSMNSSVRDMMVGDMLLRNNPSTHVPK